MAEIPAQSIEYLHGPVTASVELDTQDVEVAFLPKEEKAPTDETAWIPADWEGEPGTSRTWQLLIGPSTSAPLEPGTYNVWVRVKDDPEEPVRMHGPLKII